MDKVSYALGLGIGQQLAQMGASDLNIDDFARAIKDVISGSELKVQHRDAQQIVQDYFAKKEEKLNAERAVQGKAHKEAGEKYLAENAKKEGVITLPSGLQYQVLKEGNGKKPSAKDTVKCHYEGFLIDGTVFDSSVQRGEPATFPLQQVIAGWTEGSAADAGGCQVPLLHPLPSGLRRGRCRTDDSPVCNADLRRGADRGDLVSKHRNIEISKHRNIE